MSHPEVNSFLNILKESMESDSIIRLTLGKFQGDKSGAQKVFIRPVELEGGRKWQFLYRHATKDVTKNYPSEKFCSVVSELLGKEYYSGNLFAENQDAEIVFNRKGEPQLHLSKPSLKKEVNDYSHDRTKKAYIDKDAQYLKDLGLTTSSNEIARGKERKFRQIEKFLETFESLIKESSIAELSSFKVVDMGSGMGYLTFALYDYLEKNFTGKASLLGVEARNELVIACNAIAKKSGFDRLSFQQGRIGETNTEAFDVLIALHACDTATDDALYQAICSSAKVILSVPCCHKELRPQLKTLHAWQGVLDFGIMSERQSEMVTDGIRALLLEASGYKTSISEFISAEHTAKNILITAVWKGENPKKQQVLKKVQDIKEFFSIQEQRLEKLLGVQ